MATGEYLAFLDVDDEWHPTYLAQMCAALDSAPQAVAAFAGWQYIDESSQWLPQAVLLSTQHLDEFDQDLPWRNNLVTSAVVARRAAILRVGAFDEQLSACEDWDLWLRLKTQGPFISIPDILIGYRTHSGSISADLPKMERARLRVNAKQLGSLDEPLPAWPAIRRQAVGFTYFNSALGYLRGHDQARMIEKLQEAVTYWPGLLQQDEFYYELGCADQPRGSRGPAAPLDLATGEALIRSALFEWLDWDRTAFSLQQAWSQANLVLARLAVASRQPRAAHRYAWRALLAGPWSHKTRAARALARTLAPQWFVAFARGRRRQPAIQPGPQH